MNSKFDFYEIVEIVSSDSKHVSLNGKLGVILGMVENEETKSWTYGVSIYDKGGIVRRFTGAQIESTGNMAKPDEFISGKTVRVKVDPNTGEGQIIDD